jgi:hypothetical protein
LENQASNQGSEQVNNQNNVQGKIPDPVRKYNSQPFTSPEEDYGYPSGGGYPPQQRAKSGMGGMGSIIVAVIISLVLCYAMISLLGLTPSMSQYKADITRLELDLVDIRNVNTQQSSSLSTL